MAARTLVLVLNGTRTLLRPKKTLAQAVYNVVKQHQEQALRPLGCTWRQFTDNVWGVVRRRLRDEVRGNRRGEITVKKDNTPYWHDVAEASVEALGIPLHKNSALRAAVNQAVDTRYQLGWAMTDDFQRLLKTARAIKADRTAGSSFPWGAMLVGLANREHQLDSRVWNDELKRVGVSFRIDNPNGLLYPDIDFGIHGHDSHKANDRDPLSHFRGLAQTLDRTRRRMLEIHHRNLGPEHPVDFLCVSRDPNFTRFARVAKWYVVSNLEESHPNFKRSDRRTILLLGSEIQRDGRLEHLQHSIGWKRAADLYDWCRIDEHEHDTLSLDNVLKWRPPDFR